MKIKELAENLDLDVEIYKELLQLFRETAQRDLEKMESAIRDGLHQPLADAAHSIKGAAANLGLVDISEAAREAETSGRRNVLEGVDRCVERLRAMIMADME